MAGSVKKLDDVLSIEWAIGVEIALLMAFCVPRLGLYPRRYAFAYAMGLALILAAVGWGVGALSDRWHRGYAQHYDAMFATQAFSDLERTDPASVRVCVHDYRGYPFFGSRRQFSVCQPYYVPGPGWLMDYLHTNRATHIVVRKSPTEIAGKAGAYFWWFDQCLASYPDQFAKVCEGEIFTFFAIRKLSWER